MVSGIVDLRKRWDPNCVLAVLGLFYISDSDEISVRLEKGEIDGTSSCYFETIPFVFLFVWIELCMFTVA